MRSTSANESAGWNGGRAETNVLAYSIDVMTDEIFIVVIWVRRCESALQE